MKRLHQFVWIDDDAPRRNQFVRFEREFEISVSPAVAELHLFADTRYRLRVNGEFVACGPGRFVTQFPEYDSHSLAGLLKAGRNVISVEVNFFGASSFQSMPDGMPGFVAWGECGEVTFETPGAWRAFRLDAWRPDAPLFSFAQNPVEICDTRLVGGGRAGALRMLEGAEAPWGELTPYSGQPLRFFKHHPKAIELAGSLERSEWRTGFMANNPRANIPGTGTEPNPSVGFATWLWSPSSQAATLSCFWSELECNGRPVRVDTDTPYGNHGYCTLELAEGWNLLAGHVEILTEFWAYCLGLPPELGISAHGRRDRSCPQPLAVSPNGSRGQWPLPSPDAMEAPAGWALHDGNPLHLTPARMMAWDMPSSSSMRKLEPGRLPEVSTIEAAEATWCFSFAGEFLGHIVLDVEAPEGSVLDIATDDWQAPHGGVALYQSNPFTDAADRFVLRGGRQRIEMFHPRGGKLLQATLRSPGGPAALSLHGVFVRSRQTLWPDETRFSCGHPDMDWLWPVAMRTLITSTDESYSDCPWRERGSYIGDGYVNLHLNLLLNRDDRTAQRTLRIFSQAQLPDGQLACCAPAWLRNPHQDFTLVWILTLHDHWALTGKTDLVESVWPSVGRIWQSPDWKADAHGLWNASNQRLFLDWGVLPEEREGAANAAINIFRFGALQASARLADALGRFREAADFRAQASGVEAALLEHVWDDAEGRFRASAGATTPALHANTLALTFQIGDAGIRRRILAYLEPALRGNFAKGIRDGHYSGHLELYFFNFLLPALTEHGRPDLAELLISQHYGFLHSIGDDTLPEGFCRVEQSIGSRCHSWAGAGAIYAARYVLGIRQKSPGNFRNLVCEPIVHNISHATGRIAHPDGWIDVSWEKQNGEIIAEIKAPPTVSIRHPHPQGLRR